MADMPGSTLQCHSDDSESTTHHSNDAPIAKTPRSTNPRLAGWKIAVSVATAIALGLALGAVIEAERPVWVSNSKTVATAGNPEPKAMNPNECQARPVPQCDGTFRVVGGSGRGIVTGWIRTDGPRPGGPPHCTWTRLSGAELTMKNTLAAGNMTDGPATVEIKPGDYAFATYGCRPWQKVG